MLKEGISPECIVCVLGLPEYSLCLKCFFSLRAMALLSYGLPPSPISLRLKCSPLCLLTRSYPFSLSLSSGGPLPGAFLGLSTRLPPTHAHRAHHPHVSSLTIRLLTLPCPPPASSQALISPRTGTGSHALRGLVPSIQPRTEKGQGEG